MYFSYSLGAIFIVFILCVHCVNAGNDNEIREIYVPSAPQNLAVNVVTSTEIHLSWAPPAHRHALPAPEKKPTNPDPEFAVLPKKKIEHQSDAPVNDVIAPNDQQDTAEKLKEFEYATYNLYKNDKPKYNDDYSTSDMMMNSYRKKREGRSHRHRKRRQENGTDPKSLEFESTGDVETHQALEIGNSIDMVKKSYTPTRTHVDASQIAYVLYYEQGIPRFDITTVNSVQSSSDVKNNNVFSSDLGMEEYSRSTKNLTLVNKSGKNTNVVGFRLKNLKPFTPYKIWVRAFFKFPLDGVMSSDLLERLSNKSEPVYALTDVMPPSAPKILNLTCDMPKRTLYLQWRQPTEYNNTLDQYVVTLRKIPELQPRTRLTLPTNKNDIETTISVEVELWNVTRYEVKIYAVTQSVARANALINGSESPPEEVSSEWCAAHSEAMSPGNAPVASGGVHTAALFAIAPIALLAAVGVALVYWRCRSRLSKCVSAVYNYLEEGGERAARAPLNAYKKPVVNCSPLRSCASGGTTNGSACSAARPPRMAGAQLPAVPAARFPARVAALHADGDIGFSKEYEIVVARSAALGHTSHHSHRPENRLKNRYLNITAYDHSRVCVSAGGRCGAAGCVGAGRGAACDYVNANFIDGMLPALNAPALRRIRRRLERLRRPQRQPSTKPVKPPPNLAEGIESAFLNIEFSGIVESDEQNEDSDSDHSDEDCELDDVYVDIDGVPTRVKLEWLVWRRRYIATQGPTPATLDAFWRMIWQHRVHTIVMITNLVERGRRKCDMYWPGSGRGSSAEYGGVRVTLLHEDVRAAYTVRHMRVRLAAPEADQASDTGSGSSDGGWRSIAQYHYTVWPDHGTPRHPLAVLPFVRAAAADPGTVLVHCSAGVGRTGTYIVLDAQLNQLKLTGTLSPLGFLCRARTQRNHLVQTEEQYVFVHDALLEHVRSGNTEVEFPKAREYLVKLLEPISEEELAVLDLNSNKKQSMNDLTNGVENGDTSSIKSNQAECSEQDVIENGSQVSSRIDLDEDQSKSEGSMGDVTEEGETETKEVLVNGEETEGVYDLAPRSTDTYSKKMMAYNNMNEEEKEEIRRVNRAENYALLERMRSLANRHHTYQGPPPVNLLEKQFLMAQPTEQRRATNSELA
ncbi:tyrosine-protein phosphatase 99A-like [Ostrinia furnacalis]|uniref:tyrosine-protein phosphatase 99A-like n=1 Tax=Ostrinia furnacalis TaxID=93504 RepID=UPI00103992AF|nr:tyrosine-protein phosphatase 99A-like [Ostrinia furnacalis]